MDLEFMIALSVWLVVAIVLTVADRVLLGRWYGDQAQWLLWPVLILAAFGITILYLLTRSWPSVRLSDVPTLLASLAQIITDPVVERSRRKNQGAAMAENVIPQPGALVSIDGVGEYRFAAIVDGLAHLHPTDGTEVLIQTQISKLQLVTPNVEWTRPEWDQYFLLIARAVALRGSCRRKKVGAVLVDGERRIVGSGYNGAPRGLPDCLTNGCDVRVIDGRESCVRTLHAESNAIDFANPGANNVTLYTNVIPCRLCALRIIQTRIIRVVYEEHYQSQGTPEVPGLFKVAGIPLDHVPLP